jgi:hypothetical protein
MYHHNLLYCALKVIMVTYSDLFILSKISLADWHDLWYCMIFRILFSYHN